jgi:hypothetical protein
MQRFLRPRYHMLGILLICTACTPDFPLDREGTWSIPKVSSNEANLKVMVANPRDLVVGQSASGSVGSEAAPPVGRLVTGKRTALPSLSSTTQLNVNVTPQSTAPAENGATQNE